MVAGVAGRLDGGDDDVLGRGEVGLTGAEPDDVLSLGLQRLRPGVDGERRRLCDRGCPLRNARHAAIVTRPRPAGARFVL
jgi:hypothetical protein